MLRDIEEMEIGTHALHTTSKEINEIAKILTLLILTRIDQVNGNILRGVRFFAIRSGSNFFLSSGARNGVGVCVCVKDVFQLNGICQRQIFICFIELSLNAMRNLCVCVCVSFKHMFYILPSSLTGLLLANKEARKQQQHRQHTSFIWHCF